jgi:outer membrane lipoprotein
MKTNRIQRVLILSGLAAAVSGCATSPMSKNIRTEAKVTRHVSFARIARNPSAYKGEEVIWGGEIVKVLNEPGASKIYLSEIPLHRSGDPVYPAKSPGTFIAKTSGTVDPELYMPGRVITLGGKITEQETGASGQMMPVVTADEIHFWQLTRRESPYALWGGSSYYDQYSGTGAEEFYPSFAQVYYAPEKNLDKQANRSLNRTQPIQQPSQGE